MPKSGKDKSEERSGRRSKKGKEKEKEPDGEATPLAVDKSKQPEIVEEKGGIFSCFGTNNSAGVGNDLDDDAAEK